MSLPNNEPLVVQALRRWREALEASEAATMLEMARRWQQIEAGLDADIVALAAEFARRREAGEVITQQMIWRDERYQRLKARLEEEIARMNREYMIDAITRAQVEFGLMGAQSARDAIQASYTLGIGPSFPVINRDAIETMAGFLGDGSPLSRLLREASPDAWHGLANALMEGIGRGLNPAEVARLMADGMGMGLDRALLIARTEINRTYRAASVMQYRESNVVKGFRRLVKKETACPACLFLDGEAFDLASELDDHPNGKCMAVPVVVGAGAPRWQTGETWFKGLDEERQAEILGPGRFELWQSGQVGLKDLVDKKHDETWGDQPRLRPIAELTD